MSFKIKNWKLAILGMMGVAFLASLGVWQLSRAEQKKKLLASYAMHTAQVPLTANQLNPIDDIRFHKATINGHFDNAHTLLLDNKIFHEQHGYEVYTPFWVEGWTHPILVDRGFIAVIDRDKLPLIRDISGKVSIMGMLNLPPRYFALGTITESAQLSWPLRVEYVNLSELKPLFPYSSAFFPYVLTLDPHNKLAYPTEWEIVTIGPERHLGYAVQWFALAFTLLILSVGLNLERRLRQ